eukprot:7376907-Prymnesium_polylepis.1
MPRRARLEPHPSVVQLVDPRLPVAGVRLGVRGALDTPWTQPLKLNLRVDLLALPQPAHVERRPPTASVAQRCERERGLCARPDVVPRVGRRERNTVRRRVAAVAAGQHGMVVVVIELVQHVVHVAVEQRQRERRRAAVRLLVAGADALDGDAPR